MRFSQVPYMQDITWSDPRGYRTKFDSAMAEYLHDRWMGEADRETGECDWHYHVGQFGKRLLFSDDRGFVSCDRYDTEAEASAVFVQIQRDYYEWVDPTCPEHDEPSSECGCEVEV